jgi:hypothetical protein
VGGEEDQVMAEDRSPNYCCQNPRSCLRNDTSAFVHDQFLVFHIGLRPRDGMTKVAYRLQSCGRVADPPAVRRLPSFREEAPPRWYQAVGVLLGQPSLGLGKASI